MIRRPFNFKKWMDDHRHLLTPPVVTSASRFLLAAVPLFICSIAVPALAQERAIKPSQLPAGVRKTVTRESKGGQVKRLSTEKEDGVRTYEANIVIRGRTKDITMNSWGTILTAEQQISFRSLPQAVKTAALNEAGTGKIGRVESVRKRGRLVGYEIDIIEGEEQREIKLTPTGEKLEDQ